ncbi:(d)CMP kinase [soil metagenome]
MDSSTDPPPPTPPVVAIDGPAASGKSSVARALAAEIGAAHLNSGLTYRAATRAVLDAQIDPRDAEAVGRFMRAAEVRCEPGGQGGLRVIINGIERVGLDENDVNDAVSPVSSVPEVRVRMVAIQREIAATRTTVVEGRDIGSVVFPDTPYKFYIDAPPSVRERRRAAQGLTDSVAERDRADSSRAESPLVVPEDAKVIDSSSLDVGGVVAAIVESLAERGFPGAEGVAQ